MAVESQQQILAPNRIVQDFIAGGGAGIPGLFPLLNQQLVSQIAQLGLPDSSPFTYTGQRIADFTPQERRAFELGEQAIGSYRPFLDRSGALTEQAAQQLLQSGDLSRQQIASGLQQARDLAGTGVSRLEGSLIPELAAYQRAEDAAQRGAMDVGRGVSEAQMGFRGLAGTQAPFISSALSGLGQAGIAGLLSTGAFDPRSTGAFFNPFEDAVVQQTLQDISENLAQSDIANRAAQVRSGAFGGARGRLTSEELARRAGRGAAEAVGGIRSQGFGLAQRAAQQAFEAQQARQANQARLLSQLAGQTGALGQQTLAGQQAGLQGLLGATQLGGAQQAQLAQQLGRLGQAAGTAGRQVGLGIGQLGTQLGTLGLGAGRYTGAIGSQLGQGLGGLGQQTLNIGRQLPALQRADVQLLGNIGGTQRGMQQAGLDLDYQNFVGQYNLPMQTISNVAGIFGGLAPLAGSTTSVIPIGNQFDASLGAGLATLGSVV
mgnify:FL=1|tara:strand:+ start:5826 stop:7292 length:1467 start_codon:yes stop_codon:yes gene_type:complete